MKRYLLCTALAIALPSLASAGPIAGYSLYAGNLVHLGNSVNVNSGPVGSGDIVDLDGSVHLAGRLDAVGNVTLGNSAKVDGNVVANKVTMNGSAIVGGNLDAGQASGTSIILGQNAKVVGTMTRKAGANASTASGATFGASVVGTPATFTALALPPATSFGAGGASFNTGGGVTTTLGAGSYHFLDLGANNVLNLSAGDYYFDRLTTGGSTIFNFDLTHGAISLFITGNVHLGNGLDVNLTGGDASDVYAETKGNWVQDGFSEWFGTIYGSGADSDLSFGSNNTLTGAFYAAHNLSIDGNGAVNLVAYAPPATASNVPEPGSMLLGAIALGAMAVTRRRKRS